MATTKKISELTTTNVFRVGDIIPIVRGTDTLSVLNPNDFVIEYEEDVVGLRVSPDGNDILLYSPDQNTTLRTENALIALETDGVVSLSATGVGIGNDTPDASAALDVTSTTQGLLFPRMTEAQRDLIGTPADGLVVYNSTTNKLNLRANGAWEVITSA